jgi:NTP pyrophosphatase (non-canonical NTP hydrolase)
MSVIRAVALTAAEYAVKALRTEKTPNFVCIPDDNADTAEQLHASIAHDRVVSLLIHALLGLVSEVGEIADALKKHLIYGKPLDLVNLVEEFGDVEWYQALGLQAIGSDHETAWARNIAKLEKRYGGVFSAEKALNRDLPAERAALEGGDDDGRRVHGQCSCGGSRNAYLSCEVHASQEQEES